MRIKKKNISLKQKPFKKQLLRLFVLAAVLSVDAELPKARSVLRGPTGGYQSLRRIKRIVRKTMEDHRQRVV